MRNAKSSVLSIFIWLMLLAAIRVFLFFGGIMLYAFIGAVANYKDYFYIVIGIIYILVGSIVLLIKLTKTNEDCLQLKPFKVSLILKLYIAAMTVGFIITLFTYNWNIKSFSDYFINRFSGKESFNFSTIFDMSFAKNPFYLYDIIVLAAIFPFYEELIFRGVVYNDARQMFNRIAAFICSAILCSVNHYGLYRIGGGFFHIINVLILSLIFAYCYEKTNTIWAPILLHALVNFTSFFVLRMFNIHFYVLLAFMCIFIAIVIVTAELITYLKKRRQTAY